MSNELVASSKTINLDFLYKALAIANLCLWPVEIFKPFSPIKLLYLSFLFSINSEISAFFAEFFKSLRLIFPTLSPNAIFCAMD